MVSEKLKQKYLEVQLLNQQIKQLQQQMAMLEQQLEEAYAAKDSITEIQSVKEGTEILVPISNGIFVRAKIMSPSELLVNAGYNVTVAKTIEQGKELIDSQVTEIEKAHEYVLHQMQMYDDAMKSIEIEIKNNIDAKEDKEANK